MSLDSIRLFILTMRRMPGRLLCIATMSWHSLSLIEFPTLHTVILSTTILPSNEKLAAHAQEWDWLNIQTRPQKVKQRIWMLDNHPRRSREQIVACRDQSTSSLNQHYLHCPPRSSTSTPQTYASVSEMIRTCMAVVSESSLM